MNGEVHLNLWARVDEEGNLSIEGQDLGPRDEDGDLAEYEWSTFVAAQDVPAVGRLLGASDGEDVLDIISRDWLSVEGSGLEALIRASGIPYRTDVYVR